MLLLNKWQLISSRYCITLLLWLLLHSQCPGSSGQPAAAAAAAGAGAELGMPACSSAPTALRIPRIIHRNYMEGRTAMYAATQVDSPSWHLHWLLSCKAHHPAWAEMVWSEADIMGLIREEYAWFLSTYQTYAKHVFRSDLARFVILHKHGGVYLDADVECYKNMEPSLAGLDLVINCRTYDVAHNAAMASIAGHPVWIEAMKAAMAVVQRMHPVVSGDPLSATGPVLMSQTVQQYYGISKEEFCDNLHVKDGLVLKAYPKGQWFTPCWPWANVRCYKRLETERKFIVRSNPALEHVVGVHHYSGTWFGQGTSSKDKLRQQNRMLAAMATVSFFWESPQFIEHACRPTAATNSSVGLDNSSTGAPAGTRDGSPKQKLVHTRPGLVGGAHTQASSAAVRRLRRLLDASQPEAAPAGTSHVAQAASNVTSAATHMLSSNCPAVRQLASLQPCMVLSVIQPTASNRSASMATETPHGSAADGGGSTAYWANVDGMLSMWRQSFGCHVTVASTDALLPSKLVQLTSSTAAAAHGAEAEDVDRRDMHKKKGQGVPPPEARFVEAGGATSAASTAATAANAETIQHQAPDAAQHLVRLLQQQQEHQLHALGCDEDSGVFSLSISLASTCKAPWRHTALHLSGSADYLVDLAEHIFSYNVNASHAAFEQHGRYSGAMHTPTQDYPAVVSSTNNNGTTGSADRDSSGTATGSGSASAERVVTALDMVDMLLVDVEHPTGPSALSQGWSTMYNLLYQLHGYVGFIREALPDGRTRLGWIRRPERLVSLACEKARVVG